MKKTIITFTKLSIVLVLVVGVPFAIFGILHILLGVNEFWSIISMALVMLVFASWDLKDEMGEWE